MSHNPQLSDVQVTAVVGFLENMEAVLGLFAVAFDELGTHDHAPPKEQSTVLRDHAREYASLCRQLRAAITTSAPDARM